MQRRALILFTALLVACAGDLTQEESILRAVEEVRAAVASADPDAVWKSYSTRRRNLFREVRLRQADADRPILHIVWWELRPIPSVSAERAERMSDREFHAAVYGDWEAVPDLPKPAGVRILGDRAEVEDHIARVRWWFRLEDGDWKFEGWLFRGSYDSALEFPTGPGGNEYVIAPVSTLFAPNAHSVPLPLIDLTVEVDSFRPDTRHVALDKDRPFVLRGETLDAAGLRARLLDFAETGRDESDAMHLSTGHVHLAVHRDLPWSRAEEALRIVGDPDVRIRHVAFLTQEHVPSARAKASRAWGMPVLLESRVRPEDGGMPLPDLVIHVGNDAPSLLLRRSLREILAALPDLYVDPGVQVFLSPDLAVGPAVEALATVARRGVPEIAVHTAKKPFTGWTLNGRAIVPASKWESPDTPTVIPIVLLTGEDR